MIQRLIPAILISLLAAPQARAGLLETILETEGKLDKKDQVLPNGEWADIYTIDLQVGDRVLVEMASRKIDTYLVLRGPDGTVYENDDDDGSKKRSALDVFVETSGTWLLSAAMLTRLRLHRSPWARRSPGPSRAAIISCPTPSGRIATPSPSRLDST